MRFIGPGPMVLLFSDIYPNNCHWNCFKNFVVTFLCENVLNGSHETDDSREELNAWDCCHVPNVGVVDVMWRSGLRKLLRSRRLSEATYKLPHWIIFGSFLLQSVCLSLSSLCLKVLKCHPPNWCCSFIADIRII